MFQLKGAIGQSSPTDPEDSGIIKHALTALGYYDDTQTGLSPYPDRALFESIKGFQKAHGLEIDGVIYPSGPTQKTIKEKLEASPQALGAFYDFSKRYLQMRTANTVGADKYFHCLANFEATKRGWLGNKVAKDMSNKREEYGRSKPDYTREDEASDQAANRYGRDAAKSGNFETAEQACAIFRPDYLDEKY